jgi:hypothetical protein
MHAGRIAGATRNLGAPADWDEARDGPCGCLPIRDSMHSPGVPAMTSAWFPTLEEIEQLQRGAPIYLQVIGAVHPAVSVFVGLPTDGPGPSA